MYINFQTDKEEFDVDIEFDYQLDAFFEKHIKDTHSYVILPTEDVEDMHVVTGKSKVRHLIDVIEDDTIYIVEFEKKDYGEILGYALEIYEATIVLPHQIHAN